MIFYKKCVNINLVIKMKIKEAKTFFQKLKGLMFQKKVNYILKLKLMVFILFL